MHMNRRRFLHGIVGVASLGPLAACGSGKATRQLERRAVTMWEFSWLVRRQGAEAEYADWDRALDELAERGYDTIRLDAFPHLIARGVDGGTADTFTILPQHELFFWGNHEPVDVNPRSGLVEFLAKMRARGMKAGLSTWFNDDATHRAATIRTPDDCGCSPRPGAGVVDAFGQGDPCEEPLEARGQLRSSQHGSVDCAGRAVPWRRSDGSDPAG